MATSALRDLPMEARNARRANIGQGPYVRPDTSGQDLTGELLNAGSIALSPIPVVSDLAGLAADFRMYQMRPEERTMGNYWMTLAGLVPLVPGAAAVRSAKTIEEAASRGLDMSQGVRMQRATDEGYTIDAYKGAYPYDPDTGPSYGFKDGKFQQIANIGAVPEEISEFKSRNPRIYPGYVGEGADFAGFFSKQPDVASRFAQAYNGGAVYPVKLQMKKPLVIDAGGKPAGAFQFPDLAKQSGTENQYQQMYNAMRSGEYDGIVLENTLDEGTIYVPIQPKQVRSINAAFDPTKRNSANLMAGVAGGTVGLSALRNINKDEQSSK